MDEIEYLVLNALVSYTEPVNILALSAELAIDQSKVLAACLSLAQQNYITITEQTIREFSLGKVGRRFY